MKKTTLLFVSLIFLTCFISCKVSDAKKVKIKDFSYSEETGLDLTEELPYALTLADEVYSRFEAGKHMNLLSVEEAERFRGSQAGNFRIFNGHKPEIRFYLIDEKPKRLRLKFKFSRKGTLVVSLNGNYLNELNCRKGVFEYTIEVPSRFQHTGVNTLTFKTGRGGGRETEALVSMELREISIRHKDKTAEGEYKKLGWRDEISLKNSRVPVIKQHSVSELRFYRKIGENSYFSVGVDPQEDDGWSLRIRDREGNSLRYGADDFSGKDLSEIRVALDRFKNKIAEITLRVDKASSDDPFVWYKPKLEGTSKTAKKQSEISPLKSNSRVILITLGSAFWDRFSTGDNPRETTPNIDGLAEDSIVYENAYSSTGKALNAVLGMMSSIHPQNLKVIRKKDTFPAPGTTIAEAFFDSGYRTAGYVNRSFLKFRTGINSGFEIFSNIHMKGKEYKSTQKLTKKATDWMAKYAEEPGFLYLHYQQPALPYQPPGKFRFPSDYKGEIDGSYESLSRKTNNRKNLSRKDLKEIKRLYDGNLRFIDNQVGKLLGFLKENNYYRDSLIILTSDKGVTFGEEGNIHTRYSLDEESLNVPLIVKPPKSAGLDSKNIEKYVSTNDIFPTLNTLCNLGANTDFMQGTVLPGFDGGESNMGEIHAVAGYERFPKYADYFEGFKFITCRSPLKKELYDLSADPKERFNLIVNDPVLGGYLRARHLKWLERSASFSQKLIKESGNTKTGVSR